MPGELPCENCAHVDGMLCSAACPDWKCYPEYRRRQGAAFIRACLFAGGVICLVLAWAFVGP